MDLFIQSYTNEAKEPILDFEIDQNGELECVFNDAEIKQRAVVSAFTQKGTIPQLPNTGVEWVELLTGNVIPAEINSQIMNQIHECADTYEYIPKYLIVDKQLVVSIDKGV